MRSLFFTALSLISLNLCAQGSFQDQTVVNGVFYIATENTLDHVTYVQQDNFDFPLAADSFYVDEMSTLHWDAYSDFIIREQNATWNNGMYQTNDGCQVFIHDSDIDDRVLVVRLFGSNDF